MTWTHFLDLAKLIGVPAAMLSAALYFIYKGYFVTKREYDAAVAIHERDEEEWKARWLELLNEKNMWRDMAIKGVNITERAVHTAKTAMETKPS